MPHQLFIDVPEVFYTVLCFSVPCSAHGEDTFCGQHCSQGRAGQQGPGRSVPAIHCSEVPLHWSEETHTQMQRSRLHEETSKKPLVFWLQSPAGNSGNRVLQEAINSALFFDEGPIEVDALFSTFSIVPTQPTCRCLSPSPLPPAIHSLPQTRVGDAG